MAQRAASCSHEGQVTLVRRVEPGDLGVRGEVAAAVFHDLRKPRIEVSGRSRYLGSKKVPVTTSDRTTW
jgi:hypothetical protein